MEFLPFSAFVSCFGNSRKVENSSVSSDTLLELKSGNRIPVSSILVLLMVNSAEKKCCKMKFIDGKIYGVRNVMFNHIIINEILDRINAYGDLY